MTDTTLVKTTIVNDTTERASRMIHIPAEWIDGTGKKMSSIIQARVFRDKDDPADTYSGKLYFSKITLHAEKGRLGSHTIMTQ